MTRPPLWRTPPRRRGLPVLFSIQGIMRDCAAHLCDGVPEAYRRSGALWHAVDRVIPGELLDTMQVNFNTLASKEAALLAGARYVTGRTAFDRDACTALAPHARYYPCNETLRPPFYISTLWHPREFAAAPVLFLPQGNYPLKKSAHRYQGTARHTGKVRQRRAAHCGLAAAGQGPAAAPGH